MPITSTYEVVGGGTAVLTSDEIDAALGGRGGTVPRRWAYDWRDTQYNLLAAIRGAVQPGGSLKSTGDAEVPVTGDLTVIPRNLPFDLAAPDARHIAIVLEVLVKGQFIRLPQALMKLETGDQDVLEDGSGPSQVKLSDLSTVLQGKTSTPYTVDAGSVVTDKLTEILTALGLSSNIPSLPDITPAIISVGPGVKWRLICDRLTNVSNLYPVAPDGRGSFTTRLRLVPVDPSDQAYNVAEPTLLIPPLRLRPDRTSRFYNRAVNVFDHPDRTPGYVEAVNNDPTSNISIPSINEAITQKLPDGGYVIDDARAVQYATWFLRHQHALANSAEIRTVLDPRQGMHNQYTLNLPGIEDGTQWELLGWNVPLDSGGVMTHLIGRSVPVEIIRIA